MNAQQKAIALLIQLLAARHQRRKELMKQQFSFMAVIRDEEVVVAHGEFFMTEDVPFHEVGQTTQGVVFRNLVTGGMCFVPFDVAPAPAPVAVPAPAPVAVPAPAPVAVPVAPAVLLTTRTKRVGFGEEVVVWNSTFTEKLEFKAPSSGAVIEERFKDGTNKITFVGSIEKTWTI